MTITVYWFRQDLRLHDNPHFLAACQTSDQVIPVYCHDPTSLGESAWGFQRVSALRQQFLNDTLADLEQQLLMHGSGLVRLAGRPRDVLPKLLLLLGASQIYAEEIAAPEEQEEVLALHKALSSLRVSDITPVLVTHWQSSLLDPVRLPFAINELPGVFSNFRRLVERDGNLGASPVTAPTSIPPLPVLLASTEAAVTALRAPSVNSSAAPKCLFQGGESHALAHLKQYLARQLPHTYKATRNGLTGMDYSSKFSPWLALGALSARQIYADLCTFEQDFGANDGTYWLWFELLWRDYFRFLHLQYGHKLYRRRGLSTQKAPQGHAQKNFMRWCQGNTGQSLVDAGMRELATTGFLSNRLRQVVASYLVFDLGADWRAGAAWFESQLLDYDVTSNHANWLYIAGFGTDPRGGRRFNVDKQTREHDSEGNYRRLWGTL